MKRKKMIYTAAGLVILAAAGISYYCGTSVKVPKSIKVVENFDIEKYMGTWYEIARFDFKYEKDLKNVTATYSLQDNGKVKVVNKGYNYVTNKEAEAVGKARQLDNTRNGALKVSFFGPFYSGYNVVMMDPAYENVLVFGESTDYMWILSRNKTIPAAVKETFLTKASEAGYDLKRLVWTTQDK